ncbi:MULTISPECIES: XRE family transcriptional regulator [Aestuariibaculum]|uniref:LexA family transcriptional regulator n=1 Tax=Aestuariibaculum lutulentum TaxID=2920935 RepID=A0ABS9RMC5_9FLAO|nr:MULTISPECIES: LexA family transcriptional regulator [Aestuariibaculum]MCH4553264.1 LexA family transcriptional regulator [Aestuariibaculum lutulentum]MCR8668778.1 LexA family transcriptional regulator [Aestuariibaculum sp. M13]
MSYFAVNFKYLRTLKGFSQEQMADELNITRSRVGSYEEARSEPPLDLLVKISDYYKLPIDALVKNNLTKVSDTSFINIGNHRILFPITVSEDNEDLIEIVPNKATAGYLNGYDDPEYIEQLEKIKLPFLPSGKHRTFPIKGDSMLPVRDGSYVVARYVENIQDIKYGRTYIILTLNEGIVYKRIKAAEQDEMLTLHSDNRNYQPYEIHKKDILELWEFTCCINTQEYDESELKISSIIQMFQELGVELEQLKKTNIIS